MEIRFFPKDGIYLQGGASFGKDAATTASLNEQLNLKDQKPLTERNFNTGLNGSFGIDVVRFSLSKDWEIAVTPEVRLGFRDQNARFATGEIEKYWIVSVVEQNVSDPRKYAQLFGTEQEAKSFYDQNQDPKGKFKAMAPTSKESPVTDTAYSSRFTLAPGLSVGLIKHFDSENYARVDLWANHNVLGTPETMGGLKISAGGLIGFYGELQQGLAGASAGDTRFAVGLQMRL